MLRITGVLFCIIVTLYSASAQTGKILHKQVVRIIDLTPKEDNAIHHLKDTAEDSSFYQIIVAKIKSETLIAYTGDNTDLKNKLSFDSLRRKIGVKTDTLVVSDPIDNTELIKVSSMGFDRYTINKYKILEEWSFDPKTGKTSIFIKGIGPLESLYNHESYRDEKTLFWLSFNDLHNIISKYDQYHRDNTIAMHIWNDYFLSDVKPGVQK